MSRSVFFWNSGGTVDGNILPERKAQKRCFMFGDFLCSKFRTGGFHMKQITGNKLLVKALKEEGVEYLFGYPGACTIDISDELYKQDEIKIVLPRHEQALVHEADAYARTTGKVGVCLVTSGPGATNLVTGLATANYDSVPLVCFTGQVARHLIGNDAFQEVDIVGITRSITKYGVTVRNREDLGRIIKEAFYIARTGKPGPVLVDITKDVTAAVTEFTPQTPDLIQRQTDTICENCGRNMVIKYGPHGKFLACPGFPECRNTKPYFEKIGVKCPKCGGEIVIKKTQKGRRYYGCENYPECDVMTWQKPSKEICPKCGNMLLEKGNKLVCADSACGYIVEKQKDNA